MKNKRLKIIIGLFLLPFATILFFLDRIVLVLIFWMEGPSIKDYFKQMNNITMAIYRVAGISIIISIILLIRWILK